jgi:outer membrane protein assembly factor BamB
LSCNDDDFDVKQPDPGCNAARAAKLEAIGGGVNFMLRTHFVGIVLAAAILSLLAGCTTRPRPAPVDEGAFWPTYMGTPSRAPFAEQRIADEPPKELWSSGVGPAIRGVPVVTDEVIIAASTDRKIQTISRLDGSVFWRRKLDGPPVDPLVIGGVIYTATEDKGKLQALEIVEGDEIWKWDSPSVATPITAVGDTLYAAAEDGSVLALVSGDEELWRVYFRRVASAGPLVLDSLVVYVAYDSVFVLDRSDATLLSKASSSEIFVGEPASDGRALYLATEHGSIYAWRLPNLEFLWQASGFGNFISGPVVAGDDGYIVSRSGQLVRFDPQDGSAMIIARLNEAVVTLPTVVANGVLLGTLGGRLHFCRRNGEAVWDVELEGSIESPVVVHEGRIIVPMYTRRGGALSSGSQGRLVELR